VKIHRERGFPQSDLIPSKSYSQGVYNLDEVASGAHLGRSYLFENVRSSAHNPDTQIIDKKKNQHFPLVIIPTIANQKNKNDKMRLWMMIASGKSLYQGSGGVLTKDIELSSAFVDEPPRLK